MQLDAAGPVDAAVEIRTYLAEARDFAELADNRLARLQGVWKAVEMTDGRGLRLRDTHAFNL